MELKKEIKLFEGISILAGIMIGSGIFAFGGLILYRAGNSLGLSLLVWILGGVITLFSALTYGELGTLFPQTGGYYIYLRNAYGKKVAFLSGVMNFVLSSSGSIALLALIFADVLSYILPVGSYIKIIAAVVIIVLTVINYLGIKLGALVQKIFLVAKLLPLVVIIVLGLSLGRETVSLSIAPVEPVNFFGLIVLVGFAIIGTLWAYEGWTNLNNVTGEMKDVKRDLPKALVISVGLVTLIYVLFIFSLYRMISYQTIIDIGPSVNAALPITAMTMAIGDFGAMFVLIAILISIFGALNGTVMVFPRVYFAMAKDGLFIKQFAKVDRKYQTPSVALLGSGIMSLILLLFNIEQLLTFVVLGGLIFNTLIFISVFIFRKRLPDQIRPYKVWGYPYVPAIAILGMIMLFIATLVESFVPSLIGVGVLIVGYFIYPFIFKDEHSEPEAK
jgi:basic amino acid/polyamine antiporter, APA family